MCQETRRICETVMVQKSCYSADKPKHSAKKLLVRQFGWGNNGSAFCWSVRQSKVLTSYFITKVIYTICIHTGRSCAQMLHLWNIYRHCLKNISDVSAFLVRIPALRSPPRDAKLHNFTHERLASYRLGWNIPTRRFVDPTKCWINLKCWTYQQSAQCAI